MIDGARLGAEQVLHHAGIARRQERAARNKKLVMAALWADCHPPEGIDPDQLRLPGGERPIHPGGEGTPALAGFGLAEFGAELGMSIGGAERLIADALDLRHRLPRLWARVGANEIDGWQAEHIARETRHLSAAQAGQVDDTIADQVGRAAWAQVLRSLDAKIIEVDAERIAELAARQQATKGVWVGDSNEHGLKTMFLRGDAPAVIWLEAMIDRLAGILRSRGDRRSVDERRSAAAEILGNPAYALRLLAEDVEPTLFDDALQAVIESGPGDIDGLDLDGADRNGADLLDVGSAMRGPAGTDGAGEPEQRPDEPTDPRPVRFPFFDHDLKTAQAAIEVIRKIDPAKLRPDATLYVHIAAESVRDGCGVTRVEDVGAIVTSLVADWLRDCRVRIQPVIDLGADQISTDAYEIPKRLREEMFLRRPSSVFPYSSGSGRRLDLDHTIPYRPGEIEQTRVGNLAPLTRREHRLVTHGPWQRRQPEPGTYLFRAPYGRVFLVNASGTHDLGRDQFARQIWQTAAPVDR